MRPFFWFYVLIAQLLFVKIAVCTPLTQSYALSDDLGTQMQLLISAQSKKEAISNVRKFRKVQKVRHLCSEELKNKQIPVRCFELLELEKQLRLISIQKWQESFHWLDEICMSTLLLQKSSANEWIRFAHLGPKCKEQMGKKRAFDLYRDAEEDALKLFSSRLTQH